MVLTCFSSMFPSMSKEAIVSMNVDDIPMGEYVRISRDMIECLCVTFMTLFFIDVNMYTVL